MINSYTQIGNFEYTNEIILKVFKEFNIKIEDISTSNSNINELLFYYTSNKIILKNPYCKMDQLSWIDYKHQIDINRITCKNNLN